MSWKDTAFLIGVGLLWCLAAPLVFVTLYSALELQSAAKSAPGVNAKLATLETVSLAEQLRIANEKGQRHRDLTMQLNENFNQLLALRNEVRTYAINVLSERVVDPVSAPSLVDQCTAPREMLQTCQRTHDGAACGEDWLLVRRCATEATQRLRSARDADRTQRIQDLLANANDANITYNLAVGKTARQKTIEDEPLRAVADSYLRINLPLFRSIFILPDGVLVVCFTMLVGGIAAAVSSLVTLVRSKETASLKIPEVATMFLAAPMIGSLAGFMVYFVVVAGTAFVTQNNSGEAAPVNNLSVPALASLGVFAGLAADNAIAWLQEKAGSFFGK